MHSRLLLLFAFCMCNFFASAQKIISEQEAIMLAVKNNPQVKMADLQLKQRKALQKTAFNLPNPEVMAESPTGTFYATGVLQSLEFPGVYIRQGQLLKDQRILTEKSKTLTEQEVRRFVKSAYLRASMARATVSHWQIQDSLYTQLMHSALRQFEAGQIDFLEKSFAQAQQGEVHNQYLQATHLWQAANTNLRVYIGSTENVWAEKLDRLASPGTDTIGWKQNPALQLFRQNEVVSRRNLSVERNKAMPGLVFGYLNQGEKNSETYYRFRVGFTVPLWFWQYNGSIKAAKAGQQIAEQQTRVQEQQQEMELQQAWAEFTVAQASLDYFSANGLPQADDIIQAAKRFFETGSTDYTTYLRTLNDAYAIKLRYLQTLQNYYQAQITLNYLTGSL